MRRSKPRRAAFSTTGCIGLLCLALFASPVALLAQSTQGLILGNVKDASGSVVSGAEVRVTNVEEGITRLATTNASGDYRVADLKPSHYKIETSKSGFSTEVLQDIVLTARQELRRDITLQVGAVRQEIVVTDTATPIDTENGSISASLDSRNVLDLPANYRASRSGTSPLTLIQTLPGVQPDGNDGGLSVQGGLPSQSETSIDGISTQDVTYNSPLPDAFPSAESIAEIRVDGVGNNAEYGQPGEITSVSKSGTNNLHGGLFWYHQNRAFDAKAFGTQVKPQKIGNDFGFTLGGPVVIPHLFNGHNKTFFFATYEGFRFPQGEPKREAVPTEMMRGGDFSNEFGSGGALADPFMGGTYAGNVIPANQITEAAKQFLTLFPLPNTGDLTTLHGDNYSSNKDISYNSSQFDIRGDQNIGSKAQVFARYTWKNVNHKGTNPLLVPSSDNIDRYRILVMSFNYEVKSNLLNEFRFGFTLDKNGSTNSFNGPDFAKKVGFNGVGPTFPFNGVAELDFSSVVSNLGADRLSSITQSRTFQLNDNVEWTRGHHAFKLGFDFRKIEAITPLGFNGADNYGTFDFSGNQFTGNDFANLLLGLPDDTFYDRVTQDNDGQTRHYHLFAQDSWRVTSRLSLTYGLRWEFHPSYHDPGGNIGNFDPSVPGSGRVIYPNGKQDLLSVGFLADFNACPAPAVNGAPCTPVLSNGEAKLPSGLRTASKRRFMPRFGFAYRPFNNEKTAIRGGFGVYNITLLGRNFYSLTGTLQSDTRSFFNGSSGSGPDYQWPAINPGGSGLGPPSYGSAYFGTANDINWKDPYSMQWNLSFDHELPRGIGARVSYIGMKTDQLVWAPNYNDMSYSTVWNQARPLSDRPFPNWGTIQNRANGATALYDAMQLELRRNFRSGLSFNSSYTLAKNMADNQGPTATGFAGENGGARATYRYNRHLDFGNVFGTRRHRWLTTVIYELPVGRGKLVGRNLSPLADKILGGWQMSNIFVWQTGPFLTPYFRGGDPSGTGSGDLWGRAQHPDRAGSGVPQHQNRSNWIDPLAFICPGQTGWNPGDDCTIGAGDGSSTQAPIGRFGNSGVGVVVGPGTVNLSTGLSKSFAITGRVRLKASVSFTNILNHTNLDDPDLNISDPRDPNDPRSGFGRISGARGSDFGGSRTGQVSLRLDF